MSTGSAGYNPILTQPPSVLVLGMNVSRKGEGPSARQRRGSWSRSWAVVLTGRMTKMWIGFTVKKNQHVPDRPGFVQPPPWVALLPSGERAR